MDHILRPVFADAKLEAHYDKAKDLCELAGVRTSEGFLDYAEELADSLGLRDAERRQLQKVVDASRSPEAGQLSRSRTVSVVIPGEKLGRKLAAIGRSVSVTGFGASCMSSVYRADMLERASSRGDSDVDTVLEHSFSDQMPLQRALDTVGCFGESFREALMSTASGKLPIPVDEGQTGSVFALEADGRKVAIFKPSTGEQFERHGILVGQGAVREEAVYVLDRHCQRLGKVPVTTRGTIEVAGRPLEGAVQQFHDDATDFADDVGMPRDLDKAITKVLQEDAEGVALLDMMAFNTDRHGANLLLLGSSWPKRLGPIDHGCCLPPWWALCEAVFDAWMSWPQLQCRPSRSARHHAERARCQLPKVCAALAKLGIDRDSITTLRLCTVLVAVGVGTFGLPISSVARLMVREDYREFCWLETCVQDAAKEHGAELSVELTKRDDKVLVLKSRGHLDPEVFADRLLETLEEVFRAELAEACGFEELPLEDEDTDEDFTPLQRANATMSVIPSSSPHSRLSLDEEGDECELSRTTESSRW